MKLPGFGDELVYKCIVKNNGETLHLTKTAAWFSMYKILPHTGDIIIPLDFGPVIKPFYLVHEILWDTNKNEVIIVVVRNTTKPFI
jgi:hypothetical protein